MLSIEKCKSILQKDGASYTDEEVKQLRDLLYQLGYLDYAAFKEHLKGEKGDSVYPRLDARAGSSGV